MFFAEAILPSLTRGSSSRVLLRNLLFWIFPFIFSLMSAKPLVASMTMLLSEPFGSFGAMMPVGHAGIYLDHVCADTPVHLRLCRPGATGVVLSRYHRVANIDWLAIPVMPFLYGVDDPGEVPGFMTLPREAEIREQY